MDHMNIAAKFGTIRSFVSLSIVGLHAYCYHIAHDGCRVLIIILITPNVTKDIYILFHILCIKY